MWIQCQPISSLLFQSFHYIHTHTHTCILFRYFFFCCHEMSIYIGCVCVLRKFQWISKHSMQKARAPYLIESNTMIYKWNRIHHELSECVQFMSKYEFFSQFFFCVRFWIFIWLLAFLLCCCVRIVCRLLKCDWSND